MNSRDCRFGPDSVLAGQRKISPFGDHQNFFKPRRIVSDLGHHQTRHPAAKFIDQFTELQLTIHEGRKRQIRLMFSHLGYQVIYLKRISQGVISLGDLPKGSWRILKEDEINDLKLMSRNKIKGIE